MSSVVINGDTSGSVTLSAPATAGTVTVTLPSASGTMAVLPASTSVLAESSGGTGTTTGYYGFKNRIINGAMVIDQRNAGASVTGNGYPVDRWQVPVSQSAKLTAQQNAGSVTPPVGFTNYAGVTSSSAYSVISSDYFLLGQRIEGFNWADLGWGSANAKTVTLSFWVYSSLTGTFGGSLQNSAQTRTYPYSYTISSANTWEYKTITIAGDTTGTWLTTNGVGVTLWFSLGVGSASLGTAGAWAASSALAPSGSVSVVGTNGATFYITGVQLEKGSTATSFDYRPYGTELALCQRYYERSYDIGNANGSFTNGWRGCVTSPVDVVESPGWSYAVPKRTGPTITLYNAVSGASGKAYQTSTAASATATVSYAGQTGIGVINFPGQTASNGYFIHYTADAEL